MKAKDLYQYIDKLEPLCNESCNYIWNHPEVGGNEELSANYYRNLFKKEGFRIVECEKMPHAFYAEYGHGKPVVAVLGEYDALPLLSQKVSVQKEAVEEGAPGHGCGHNILGSAAATGTLAIKKFLEETGTEGTVRFYGSPEEELLCGKVKMIYYGMFDDCDFALSWHPGSCNYVLDKAYLANASGKFYFKGISSHAAFAPERGRSALDAVELMNVGVQYLREHVIDRTRIHYTTDSGGYAPNIVPPNASSWYFVRAPFISDVKDTLSRVQKISEGAAMMTETSVEFKLDSGCCEMLTNNRFADLTYEVMQGVDFPTYTKEELLFAEELQNSLAPELVAKERTMFKSDTVMYTGLAPRKTWEEAPCNASTDSGDVSYMMPMNLFNVACWPLGVAPHTWQASGCAGYSIAEKAAVCAAKIIAGTAYELYTKPDVRKEIMDEFEERKVYYTPMYKE